MSFPSPPLRVFSPGPPIGGKGKGSQVSSPEAIDDLSALATLLTQVTLNWTEPPDGGSSITGNNIQRADDGVTFIDIEANTGTTDTFFVDNSVLTGVTYTYRVGAINDEGQGPFSNEATVTPGVPDGIIDLVATATGDGEVTTVWTLPNDNGAPLTSLEVERAVGVGPFVPIASLPGVDTFYIDGLATNDEVNTYRITAVNSEGPGPLSNTDSATPTAAPTIELFSVDVVITGQGGKDGKNNIVYTVTATDTGASPVVGALISMDIILQPGVHESVSGSTGVSGTVVFSVKKAPDGAWNFANVVGSHPDALIDWDGIAPPAVADFPKP